jgi:hypothetical protein
MARYCFCKTSGYWFATHSAVVPWADGRLRGPDDAQVESREVAVGRPLLLLQGFGLLVCHARASGGWLLLTGGAIVRHALGVWRGPRKGSLWRATASSQSRSKPPLLGSWHCASARGGASEGRPARMQSCCQRQAAGDRRDSDVAVALAPVVARLALAFVRLHASANDAVARSRNPASARSPATFNCTRMEPIGHS